MSEVGRMVDWNPTVTSGSIIGGKEWNSVFFQVSKASAPLCPIETCCFQGASSVVPAFMLIEERLVSLDVLTCFSLEHN